MIVVASIDGYGEAPAVYEALCRWIASKQRTLGKDVWLYVTGTPERRGKPLAIDHGVHFVKRLVVDGVHDGFPQIYFSTDADVDMGPHALEHIASGMKLAPSSATAARTQSPRADSGSYP
jgi:hypothetical protein